MDKKIPIILIFVGYYLPGNKGGGLIRAVSNLIAHLNDSLIFKIVTRDRDIGDTNPYQGIQYSSWVKTDHGQVYYFSENQLSFEFVKNIINNTDYDVIYLNSFFDKFTIIFIVYNYLFNKSNKKVIIDPRGEFAWASLKQKFFKKMIYIVLIRLLNPCREYTWHASSDHESEDIVKIMGVNREKIVMIPDLSTKFDANLENIKLQFRQDSYLRIIFLSRISPEKNLDYALKVLSKLSIDIRFDIYGNIENIGYWKKCMGLIKILPKNIIVNYCGVADSAEVKSIFSRYDLFFFPTGGEAWGHVIIESLQAGTPVLISNMTPWRYLQNDEFGWDLDLKNPEAFVNKINEFSKIGVSCRLAQRSLIASRINHKLRTKEVCSEYFRLLSPNID